MMKTPITVLQELMVKYSEAPEYECVAQSGPKHLAVFEYRCTARGHVVSATARSKKEAKQEAARLMLLRLAAAGLGVPAQYSPGGPGAPGTPGTLGGPGAPGTPGAPGAPGPAPGPSSRAPDQSAAALAAGSAARSYKALLKELCQEYHLPGPEYSLEGDTGPAHARRFTARCAVGAHSRMASATTKKAAQQLAAHQLYLYLRENLARLTEDFVEEEALARAHERAMERYVAARDDAPWRPDLAQRVADYHLGLLHHCEEEQVSRGRAALAALGGARAEDGEPAVAGDMGAGGDEPAVAGVAAALGLRTEWQALGALQLLRLAPTSPPLVFAGESRAQAAAAALSYLRLALAFSATP